MPNPNLECAMQEAVNIHKQRRQVAKLVDYLITVLRIPDGNHLVMFFGSGIEISNREAMITWVSGIIHEFDADEAEERLDKLAKRTRLRLIDHMEFE